MQSAERQNASYPTGSIERARVRLPLNFGHRWRQGSGWKKKLYGCYSALFGVPNMFKRQQVHDIFRALDLKSEDRVLDFGCTTGYIALEMAKLARRVDGLDILEFDVVVPAALRERFEYHRYSGKLEEIPFDRSSFDKILVSAVLQAFPDPALLFRNLRRLLKPEGRLVVVQGVGRPIIEEAYRSGSILLRVLSLLPRSPRTFAEYESSLMKEFHTEIPKFQTVEEIAGAMENAALAIEKQFFAPVDSVVWICEWYQFFCKAAFGRAAFANNPVGFLLLHPICSVLRRLSTRRTLACSAIFVARLKG